MTVVILSRACFSATPIDFTYVLPRYFDFVHGVAAFYRTVYVSMRCVVHLINYNLYLLAAAAILYIDWKIWDVVITHRSLSFCANSLLFSSKAVTHVVLGLKRVPNIHNFTFVCTELQLPLFAQNLEQRQWHRKQFESTGTQFPALNILLCSSTFSWCHHMTGHCRKVQGRVTRTELGQRWPSVRGLSDLWTFKVTLRQRWPRQPMELGVERGHMKRSPNSISCTVSDILHVNPQTYFWPI